MEESGRGRRWSTGRLLVLLFGGLLLVAVVIEVMQRLVGPPPAPPVAETAPEPDSEPVRPEVSREGNTLVIKMGSLMTSRITTDSADEADLDALEECLRIGYEREFGEPAEGAPGSTGPLARIVDRHRIHEAASRIQSVCMQEHLDFPAVPAIPSAPQNRSE